MTHPGFHEIFPVIVTARVILRQITHADAQGIFTNFSDPDITKWFFRHPFSHMEQATRIIDEFNLDFAHGKGLTWAITTKETDSFMGTCGYGEVDYGKRGEIGFDLAKEYWGKGLMTESLTAIIDYGFQVLNLSRIDAVTYSNNTRAIRLLEKLGFQFEKVSGDSHCFFLSREDRSDQKHG